MYFNVPDRMTGDDGEENGLGLRTSGESYRHPLSVLSPSLVRPWRRRNRTSSSQLQNHIYVRRHFLFIVTGR